MFTRRYMQQAEVASTRTLDTMKRTSRLRYLVLGEGGGVMLRYEKIERRGERSDPLEKSLQRDCYESPRKAAAPWQLVAVLLMKRWAERQYRGMRQNSRTLVSS